jgi:hypothetical protein
MKVGVNTRWSTRTFAKFPLFLALVLAVALTAGDAFASKQSRSSRGKKLQSSRSRSNSRKKAARSRSGRRRAVATRGRRSRRGRSRRSRSYEVADAGAVPRVNGIPTERATEIQNALIKRGYLDGPPSGQWDDGTVDAMKAFQSDNGISATGMPSAPSLKRLGVSKRPQDGYAIPVRAAAKEPEKTGVKEKEREKRP